MVALGAIKEPTAGTPNRVAGIDGLTANLKVADGAIAIGYCMLIASPPIIPFSKSCWRTRNCWPEIIEGYDSARALALSKTSARTARSIRILFMIELIRLISRLPHFKGFRFS